MSQLQHTTIKQEDDGKAYAITEAIDSSSAAFKSGQSHWKPRRRRFGPCYNCGNCHNPQVRCWDLCAFCNERHPDANVHCKYQTCSTLMNFYSGSPQMQYNPQCSTIVMNTYSQFGPATQTWTFDKPLNLTVAADGTLLDDGTGYPVIPQLLNVSPAHRSRKWRNRANRRARSYNTTNENNRLAKQQESNTKHHRASDISRITKSRAISKRSRNRRHATHGGSAKAEQDIGEGRIKQEDQDHQAKKETAALDEPEPMDWIPSDTTAFGGYFAR